MTFDLNTDNLETLSEAERAAYAQSDTEKALLIARVIELLEDNERLEEQIKETTTLADWEKENGPADYYMHFFYECFERLSGHYPCPSVTSDYDKNVIFEAIEKGEGTTE